MARILGLDIGPVAVRGTLVTTALRRTEVQRYVEVPVRHATEPEARTEALREAVQTLVAQIKQAPDGVIAELDGREGASLRIVELPARAAKNLGQILPNYLEDLLPFPVEEAVVDYQEIERTPEQLRLLATAAPKENIAKRLEELRAAGVDPKEFAVGAAALDGLVPVLPQLASAGPYAIVDVEEDAIDVCLLRNGRCELARTLSVGLRDMRAGNRTAVEAQLRHTFASYRASDGPPLEGVFVSGDLGSAENHSKATQWLAEVTGCECRVLPLPPGAGADDDTRPRFARATALAGRSAARGKRIDLRQGEFARRRAMGVLQQNAKRLAIGAVVVLLSFAFASYARWTILDDEQQALEAQLSNVTEELFDQGTTSPERARELLSGEAGPSDPLPRFDAFDALDAISRLIPTGEIQHDTRRLKIELDEEEGVGRLELQGTVESIAQRDTIAGQLEQHECITELEKGRTSPGPGDQGLNYQLEATLDCPDEGPSAGEGKDQQARAEGSKRGGSR